MGTTYFRQNVKGHPPHTGGDLGLVVNGCSYGKARLRGGYGVGCSALFAFVSFMVSSALEKRSYLSASCPGERDHSHVADHNRIVVVVDSRFIKS